MPRLINLWREIRNDFSEFWEGIRADFSHLWWAIRHDIRFALRPKAVPRKPPMTRKEFDDAFKSSAVKMEQQLNRVSPIYNMLYPDDKKNDATPDS